MPKLNTVPNYDLDQSLSAFSPQQSIALDNLSIEKASGLNFLNTVPVANAVESIQSMYESMELTQQFIDTQLGLDSLKKTVIIDAVDRLQTFSESVQETQNIIGNFFEASVPEQDPLAAFLKTNYAGTLSTSSNDITFPQLPTPNYTEAIETQSNISTTLPVDSIDFNYNTEGYKYLYIVETTLRTFIQLHIIDPHEKELENYIGKDVLASWQDTKSKTVINKFRHNFEDRPLIEYSDFTHLRRILSRRSSRKALSSYLNEDQITSIVVKLQELEPIRLSIAHNRQLNHIEYDIVKLYSRLIPNLINRTSLN